MRRLYLLRHGAADPFGELTAVGRRQTDLLGGRLGRFPVERIWHSPLPRAADTALGLARHLPRAEVRAADELVDHVPHVPAHEDMPAGSAGFFDGYDAAEAEAGRRTADALVARFGAAAADSGNPAGSGDATDRPRRDSHEVLVTHDYPVAWLVRDALGAPTARWLGLRSANAALTVLEHRPGQPPSLVMFNDMSHLPHDLRWTGFPDADLP